MSLMSNNGAGQIGQIRVNLCVNAQDAIFKMSNFVQDQGNQKS